MVASIASTGAKPVEMTLDAAGIEAQAGDIDFGIRQLVDCGDVDREKIAVLGFSMGAASGMN